MIARILAVFRLPALRLPKAKPGQVASGSRRRAARATVWSFAFAFVAVMAGLVVSLETVKPEWRDPEFAVRLNRLRRWQAEAPNRPLVIAFGSSRTQMGLDPASMGFPDEPGSPIVYNFGYRAGHPMAAWFHFTRVVDAGVKPAAVLIQIAPAEVMIDAPAEKQFPMWASRFSLADLRRLEPFTSNPKAFEKRWRTSREKFWSSYREAIMSDLLPRWQPQMARYDYTWEFTDDYGFAPHPCESIPDDVRAKLQDTVRREQDYAFKSFGITKTTLDVFRAWADRCKAEGIPFAFYWSPESANMRSWYSPQSLKMLERYERRLTREFGAPVFPGPTHLAETDFLDCYHLLRHGAAKYSRWLADTHLRPWLAAQGLLRQ